MAKPLACPSFKHPQNSDLDKKLVLGAVLFGIGWGIGGICPGPMIAGLLPFVYREEANRGYVFAVFAIWDVLGIYAARGVKAYLDK
eukprot:CAMPEP_0197868436 /NCGR_PEP_ID=MMETSP1438-20131217/45286_1 /TAXON_ID=1461541 /ORGANISM="Pterosperma sp., Strain CCMP1384" /LENGTH=85 /DNA_ID=CAMNT_0043487143 /DNA_START=62 /DNA_END=319 /DNA_ORIENTATION=+